MGTFFHCPDCHKTVFGNPGDHRCNGRLAKAVRTFEPSQPSWVEEASASEELLTRVRRFVRGRFEWEVTVAWNAAEKRIVRRVQVVDPGLPSPHDKQVRELHHAEDWEPVFQELGLLP